MLIADLEALLAASQNVDWEQVRQNGGPPCFHVEDGRFCLRAQRWEGHKAVGFHKYTSLAATHNALPAILTALRAAEAVVETRGGITLPAIDALRKAMAALGTGQREGKNERTL